MEGRRSHSSLVVAIIFRDLRFPFFSNAQKARQKKADIVLAARSAPGQHLSDRAEICLKIKIVVNPKKIKNAPDLTIATRQ